MVCSVDLFNDTNVIVFLHTLLPRLGAHVPLSGTIKFPEFFKIEFLTFSGACALNGLQVNVLTHACR